MEELSFNPGTSKDSKYNEWTFKMLRIANLQSLANTSQMNRDYYTWLDSLSCLYKEIAGKLTSDERDQCVKSIARISKKLRNNTLMKISEIRGYQEDTVEIKKRNIESELFDFDTSLRILLDKHKFGTPDKEEDLF